MDLEARGQRELQAFRDRYSGGYLEGDPLDPLAPSGFLDGGYMSVLHACYLVCIKPYVNSNVRVLEIGPGRGAWTKCFVTHNAKEVLCVDAVPAERNGFWDYVGCHEGLRYLVTEGFSLEEVADEHFDYFFSFGVFCHISPPLVERYIRSVHRKLRSGANGFFLIADYEKYNHFLDNRSVYDVRRALSDCFPTLGLQIDLEVNTGTHFHDRYRKSLTEDDEVNPNRWYHLGVSSAALMLRQAGFEIVSEDVGVIHRDPVMHFRKP